MKKIFTGIIFVSLFMVMSSSLFAQSEEQERRYADRDGEFEKHLIMQKMHGGGHDFGRGMRGERGHMVKSQKKRDRIEMLLNRAEELDLSDDQIEKMKSMKFDFQMEKIDHQARLKKAALILRKIRRDKNSSQEEIFKAIDEVFNLKAEGQKAKYVMMQETKSVLTKKQLEKLHKKQKGMKKRRGTRGEESGTYYRQRQKGK